MQTTNNTIEAERDYYLDNIKAIAIILVVIGHIIQYLYTPMDFDNNIIFRLIYSFHMPLFMFVSGWLTSGREKKTCRQLLRRISSLLLPFFTWFFIYFFVNSNRTCEELEDWIEKVLVSPDSNGLWFLWVLALLNVFQYADIKIYDAILHKHKNLEKREDILKTIIYIITIFLVIILGRIFNYGGGVRLASWHISFFFSGNLMANMKRKNNFNIRKSWKICIVIIYFILALFWYRSGVPLFITNLPVSFLIKKIIALGYKYTVPFLGIYTVFVLVRMIPYKIPMLNVLGENTLEIYAMNYLFMRSYTNVKMIDYVLTLCFALYIPVIINKFIQHIPFVRFILFGKNPKKNNHIQNKQHEKFVKE